jgi:hypothetical protein
MRGVIDDIGRWDPLWVRQRNYGYRLSFYHNILQTLIIDSAKVRVVINQPDVDSLHPIYMIRILREILNNLHLSNFAVFNMLIDYICVASFSL